jgi:hypothetical protein
MSVGRAWQVTYLLCGVRRRGGTTLIQALYWNGRSRLFMQRERFEKPQNYLFYIYVANIFAIPYLYS